MPVHRADSAHDHVGAYNRLSATQAKPYRACPRLWYYQRAYRFTMPQIPVLFVGRAVEEALCRGLRDSPGLLTGGAPGDTLGPSPYQDDGEPVPKGEAAWPADGLMPLFPNERPDSMAALRTGPFSDVPSTSLRPWSAQRRLGRPMSDVREIGYTQFRLKFFELMTQRRLR